MNRDNSRGMSQECAANACASSKSRFQLNLWAWSCGEATPFACLSLFEQSSFSSPWALGRALLYRAENAVLHHQVEILRRRAPRRVHVTRTDRLFFKLILRLWPKAAGLIRIVHPKTLVRWHREGFRLYWRWRSRKRGGRPKIPKEIRVLVRQMSTENPLWGRAEDSWRVAEAGLRHQPGDGIAAHAEATAESGSDMEDVPPQSPVPSIYSIVPPNDGLALRHGHHFEPVDFVIDHGRGHHDAYSGGSCLRTYARACGCRQRPRRHREELIESERGWSGREAFVTMMQTADLGQGNDRSGPGRLNGSSIRCVLADRQVGP